MVTKNTLIEIIAEKEDITKTKASRILSLIGNGIMEAVSNGERVTIAGFGTFESKERSERDGVNPFTGEKTHIPASKGVKFKPGKAFKESVNK